MIEDVFVLYPDPIVGDGGRLGWRYLFDDGSPTVIVLWLDDLEWELESHGTTPADTTE